jgi:iron-sulfur cluster repair protein YtfE (RIC family)
MIEMTTTAREERMETETLASALQREHHEIDAGIDAYLAERGEAGESLAQAMVALRRHIYLEEQFLFPPLREAGFVAPIFVMLREHGELWQTMESIDRDLAEDASLVPGECKWLLAQLAKHNAKEEPILYPHADGALTAPASVELREFLRDGRVPDGWVCSGASA